MLIALDFDGTYTADPVVWDLIIKSLQERGHAVHIVTLRDQNLDRLKDHDRFWNMGVRVVYCDGRSKLDVAKEMGLEYDIWIEDDPRCVQHGSSLNPEQLEAWRKRDRHGPRQGT